MNQTQIDKCEKIFNHYGREKQLIQLQEELGELQAAVAREIAGKENNMDEELADSLIMLEQFYLCDTKTNKNIDTIINDKLNRQLSRIFGEGYSQDKKENNVSGWVEFAIDKNGIFEVPLDNGSCLYCFWFEVESFLGKSKRENLGFTVFGGYQYDADEPDVWYMQPMIMSSDSKLLYDIYKCTAEPIIPYKIRFWRSY